jgi:hypothetical protein
MPQIFPPNANAFTRWALVGGALFVGLLMVALPIYARTVNQAVGVPVAQPVDFPHNLHTAQLGIDCRYCHTSVEVAANANVPATETCMTCHSQIRVGDPRLAAVAESWESGVAIAWNRVHDVPDYVFFNHSAHINNGVGCSTCHGRVDQMTEIWKNESLTMGWCLECHWAPERFVRPRSEVFNMAYVPPTDQLTLGTELVAAYHIDTDLLPQCSTCHR